MNTTDTQAIVIVTINYEHEIHSTAQAWYTKKKKKKKSTMKACVTIIILSQSTKPIQSNSTKWPQPIFEHTYHKTQQQLKNPRNQDYNHEILRENMKTHTFSWRLKLRRC